MLALACGLRVAGLLSLSTTIYFDTPRLDEAVYHTWASQLASGTYPATSAYPAAPLPAYVMAMVYWVLSPDILYIRILNIFFGVAICFIVYRIGWELADRRIGLAAGFLAALYKPFIFYSIVPLKTSLAILLFGTAVLFFLAALPSLSPWNALSVGIIVGLLVNVRENALVLIPTVLGTIGWSTYCEHKSLVKIGAPLVSLAIGLIIAAGPFVMRNYLVSGEWVLTSHQGGVNLYLGNNLENPDPYYRPVPFASSDPSEQRIHFTIEASRRAGRRFSPSEASSYWISEVVQIALIHPTAFLGKLGQKTLVLFNRFEAGDHYDIDFMSRFATFFQLPFPDLAVILPLGLAGMVTAGFISRQAIGATVACITYASTLIIFFTNDRYRLPLLTVLIPFAVVGLDKLRVHVTQAHVKSVAIYAAAVILFTIVEYLPVRATDDVTAHYNTHARLLDKKGFEKEAMEYWERSSSMNKSFSAFANLWLAHKYLGINDFTTARSYLEKIPENSFAATRKYVLLGDLLSLQGQPIKAVAAYERAVTINSGDLAARSRLVNVLQSTDSERAQREREGMRDIASFYR